MEVVNKDLYPKTERVKIKDAVTLTEKIDGSNLGIFKVNNDLIIALRENYFYYSSVKDNERANELINSYTGLKDFLEDHAEELIEKLYDHSGFFGEWMTKSRLAYPEEFCGGKWFIFAKARLEGNYNDFKIDKLSYNHNLFIYPFADQVIPSYIQLVPVIKTMDHVPDIIELNKIYDNYRLNIVNRNVEGIIVIYNDQIRKYVRMKKGKLEDHHE